MDGDVLTVWLIDLFFGILRAPSERVSHKKAAPCTDLAHRRLAMSHRVDQSCSSPWNKIRG